MQIVLIIVGAWVVVVLSLFVLQRKMVFPAPPPLPVASSGALELVRFGPESAQGAALWVAPAEGGPVVVHFHGNAEQLAGQAELAALYGRRGIGFLAVEFPGYGPLAEQETSEQAIVDHATAAIRYLREELKIPRERTVLQGRSLGSGAACALAAAGEGARLVLLSPFKSLPDVAAGHYPWVPVRLLLRDRFDNLTRAKRIDIPVVIVHGEIDGIVPYSHGKALAETFPEAELVTIKGAGHNDLLARGGQSVFAKMMSFALGTVQ